MSMKPKIAFVNNSDTDCGVYEYGKLTFLNLQKSENYDYHFLEASNVQQFVELYTAENYEGSIWNCGPFAWMIDALSNVSTEDKPVFVITGHGRILTFPNAKHHFICDPTISCDLNLYTPVERPLVNVEGLSCDSHGEVIKIGSFGFGGWKKNFTGIVEAVNKQFTEPVEINLHITYGYWYEYHKSTGIAHVIADKCREIANPNVVLNITHEYMNNYEDVVRFLNSNDINMFLYDMTDDIGISSCVDFALMAKKPLIVNRSNMFKSINWKNELLFECNTIKEVLERGLTPTNEFREKWCNDNIIKTFENQLNRYIVRDYAQS